VIAGEANGVAEQISRYVVQTQGMKLDPADRGEEATRRPIGPQAAAWLRAVAWGQICASRRVDADADADESTVHGHRLGSIFDSAGDSQSAVCPQRIVGCAMARARTSDALRIPGDDRVEQAHAALMRNMAHDPGAI
jgi:hypothetical protein